MSEVKQTKVQLQSIASELSKATPDDIVKVISLLAIAQLHVEKSGCTSRGETLYVLLAGHKVMEKYNDMMNIRPHLMSRATEQNFYKHVTKIVKQLKTFCKEL